MKAMRPTAEVAGVRELKNETTRGKERTAKKKKKTTKKKTPKKARTKRKKKTGKHVDEEPGVARAGHHRLQLLRQTEAPEWGCCAR